MVTRVFVLQVKQIMEEAVTKKFVHEDSSHVIALCSEYEARSLPSFCWLEANAIKKNNIS